MYTLYHFIHAEFQKTQTNLKSSKSVLVGIDDNHRGERLYEESQYIISLINTCMRNPNILHH